MFELTQTIEEKKNEFQLPTNSLVSLSRRPANNNYVHKKQLEWQWQSQL